MMKVRIVKSRRQGGFTLVELVMGMLISGFLLLAVATISFAVGRGQEVTGLMMGNQSVIRSVSVRVSELVRNGLAVWRADDGDLVIWTADTNGNRRVETSELAYLMINTSGKRIELMTCPGLHVTVTAAQILSGSAETTIRASTKKQIIPLVKGCSDMQLIMQENRYVIVQFKLPEETGLRDYQICARVRADISDWMGAL